MATTNTATVVSNTSASIQSLGAFTTTFSGSPAKNFSRQFNSTDITKVYFATYSVTNTPTSVDVTALTDAYNTAISFVNIKHLCIINNDTSNNLTVGGGANALFATLLTLEGLAASAGGGSAGSCVNLTTNYMVSGSTNIITLVASAGTISIDLFLLGN